MARRPGELEACRRELSEALDQQAATSEVLHVISSSPGQLQAVFETNTLALGMPRAIIDDQTTDDR